MTAAAFVPAYGFEDRYEIRLLANNQIRVRSRISKRVVRRSTPGYVMLTDAFGKKRLIEVSMLLPPPRELAASASDESSLLAQTLSALAWIVWTFFSLSFLTITLASTTIVAFSAFA